MNPEVSHAISNIRTSRRELFLQIVFVFVLPIILLYTHTIPIWARVPLLVVLTCCLTLILYFEKWTPRMLGIVPHTFKKYLLHYLVFTLIGVVVIAQFSEHVMHTEEVTRWWQHSHFLYMFFVVSFFQEVAYRGYLIPALGKLSRNPAWIMLANTLLFTLLHTIFPDMAVSLSVAFVAGVGFSIMYMKYPSLPLIIISHSILNFVAVLFGLFVIPGVTY